MAKQLLHESSATPLTRAGKRWKATLITPGQGSSGFYSESVLAESVKAFAPGTKDYFKHPDKNNPQRDPRDQWGFIPESVKYEPGVGLTAEIEILPHWLPVVESLAEAGQASLSIWAMGETDDDGNVTALEANIQNSVDLVAYPGRPGSGLTEKMYESARAASEKPAVEASAEEKEGEMEEVLKELRALRAEFTTFVTESKTAALANVKAEADADAIEKDKTEAVESAIKSYDQKIAAIDAAELLPSQVESLRAVAVAGGDVAPLIESAKKVVAEAKVLAESASGYVAEDANGDDYSVAGWGN